MKKLSNTEAELKKSVAYKKRVYDSSIVKWGYQANFFFKEKISRP